jgi:hypothetical protein
MGLIFNRNMRNEECVFSGRPHIKRSVWRPRSLYKDNIREFREIVCEM